MKRIATLALAGALLAAVGGPTAAQQPAPRSDRTPHVSSERARAIALARVPNHTGIKSEKLKVRDGILVYEFDIETPGAGHREIRVNAHTGAIVANKHEDDLVGATAKDVEKAAKKAARKVEKEAKRTAKSVAREVDEVFDDDDIDDIRPVITEARARAIALRQVPNGRVDDIDLETENGYLVWEVEVDSPTGDQELLIDATSGAILKQKVE